MLWCCESSEQCLDSKMLQRYTQAGIGPKIDYHDSHRQAQTIESGGFYTEKNVSILG